MAIIRALSTAVVLGVSLMSCSGGGDKSAGTGSLDVNGNPVVNILGVTWTAPSQREDGNPLALSEIQSFRIYYGTAAGDYQHQIDVIGSAIDETQVEGIPAGTYYVVVTTVDTAGRESLYSDEVVITI